MPRAVPPARILMPRWGACLNVSIHFPIAIILSFRHSFPIMPKHHPYLALIPAISILLFLVVYVLAAWQYPGGSFMDSTSVGYQFTLNFWCELLADTAKNGMPNPGKPIAMVGMVLLCFGLLVFWWLLPIMLQLPSKYRRLVQICGMVSMLLAIFIFTPLHDVVINIAGGFGMVALLGLLVSLYQGRNFAMLATGGGCALMVLANNFIYHSGYYIEALPVIQKLSFALILGWLLVLDMMLYSTLKKAFTSRVPPFPVSQARSCKRSSRD
ncbi:hypothetical protein BH09BAC1_BH09BAC1_08770 [soil metagenome]